MYSVKKLNLKYSKLQSIKSKQSHAQFNFHTSEESFKNKKLCCSHNVSGTDSVSIGSSLTFTSSFVTVCKISFASGLTDFFRMDNNEGSLLKVLDKCSERSHSAAANNSYEIFERYLLAT